MIDPATLKPFLLHQDKNVRAAAAEFFAETMSDDPTLMPLVIQGCEKYGETENLDVLANASHFPIKEVETLFGLGDLLNKTTDRRAIHCLNAIIGNAPVRMLEKHLESLRATARVFLETIDRFYRRREFAGRTADELWQDLLEFAEKAESVQYWSQLDHGYLGDLIEALARHPTPTAETIRQLMDSPSAQEGWLEGFLGCVRN